MMIRSLLASVVLSLMAAHVAHAQQFARVAVPADPEPGHAWRLNEDLSDDFEYDFSPTPERTEIGGKWVNHYFRGGWNGPGTTNWRHENVAVTRGKLWIRATRVPGETEDLQHDKDDDGQAETLTLPATRLGCITSLGEVTYPAYVEARVRIANAVLASNVWMLSGDSTQEIDILESYGGRGDDNRADWLSQRLHMSHHVFIRRPFQDYQPHDKSTWYHEPGRRAKRGEGYWTGRFFRIGVHWKSPTHLDYYLNGELVKTTSGLDDTGDVEGIDPRGYTKDASGKRTGLNKPMRIVINMEAQDWNAVAGRQPTDEELKRKHDHTFLVDWVRVYQPTALDSDS